MKNTLLKLQNFSYRNNNLIISFVLIFALLISLMPPSSWLGNEEQYLGYAWRRFSPENITQISALRDTSNHRFLFENLVGFSIKHIGFERTHSLGRIIVALLYAVSLVSLFGSLRLSIIASCTVILVFVWLGENILGGEWLFRGFEPKTLTYPFVFLSFSSSIKERFSRSYLLLVPATYFHFQVGGFWFLITCLCQLYWTRDLKRILLNSLKYFIACIPLFLVIGFEQLQAQGVVVNANPSADWIYSVYRAPHHVAPFAPGQFINWYKRIVFLFCLTFISIIIYYFSMNKIEKEFSKLIICLNIYLVLSLAISFFYNDGSLGKYYLFRPSSVILFSTLCLYILFLKHRFSVSYSKIIISALVLSGFFILPKLQRNDMSFLWVVKGFPGKEIMSSLKNHEKNQDLSSIIDDIVQSGNTADIFLIDFDLESKYIHFERKYNRPTLVSKQFIPTSANDIVRWYELLNRKQELFRNGCPAKIIEEYPVKYLLAKSDKKSVNTCGNELFVNEDVKLIAVSNSSAAK